MNQINQVFIDFVFAPQTQKCEKSNIRFFCIFFAGCFCIAVHIFQGSVLHPPLFLIFENEVQKKVYPQKAIFLELIFR